MIDVSVIIPAFNAEKFIGPTIDSAFNHADITVEVIVGDDGSTDATEQVSVQHGASVIRYKHNVRKARLLNKIWKYAGGRYVLVLDHDDLLESDCLTAMVTAFDRLIRETDSTRYFMYGQTQYHNKRTSLIRPKPYKEEDFWRHNPVCSVVMVHRETVVRDNVIYFPDPRVHALDWMYLLLLIEAGYTGYPLYDMLVLHYNYVPKEDDDERYAATWPVMQEYFGDKLKNTYE